MSNLKFQVLILCVGLVLVTASSIQVSSWWLTRQHNENLIAERIDNAHDALVQYLEVRQAALVSSAEVLATDFGFRKAIATGDIPTINSMLDNHGRRLDADLMLLTGTSHQFMAGNEVGIEAGPGMAEHLALPGGVFTPDFVWSGELISRRLLEAMRDQAFQYRDQGTRVTIRLGAVCLSVEHATATLNENIDLADKALYRARDAGRNCAVLDLDGEHHTFFEPDIRT